MMGKWRGNKDIAMRRGNRKGKGGEESWGEKWIENLGKGQKSDILRKRKGGMTAKTMLNNWDRKKGEKKKTDRKSH